MGTVSPRLRPEAGARRSRISPSSRRLIGGGVVRWRRGGIRWWEGWPGCGLSELGRALGVGQVVCEVAALEVDPRAGFVSAGIAGIESDGLAVVGDGSIELVQQRIAGTPVVIKGRVGGARFQGPSEGRDS